ncbi:hypothetical protein N7403_31765 [Pseudomonas nitroreducens]|uniref:hypothetical protein n=1 Tax=Pseudomonas TaxID=286 RepID=UPI001CF016F8|nr:MULTISPECIES: hypothetical protein [Pseudomonas]MDG9858451.1 hypothetical protein [Pseudomonas nitroreducens]UCL84522.1 hypothetical protein LDJ84_16215 [Pseudomonas sp. HS-18]
MAKRPTNKARLKVWTESSTAEMEGGIKDCAYYLFMFVPEADRAQLLEDMKQWHEEVTAK